MGKAFVLILFLAFSTVGFGQDESDSTSWKDEYAYSGKSKDWKFLFGFDARRSFFAGRPVKINGIRIGAEYNGVNRFGIGFYGLSRGVVFEGININKEDATDTSLLRFNAGLVSLFYERVLWGNKRWEINAPVHLGGGSIQASYTDTAGVYRPLVEEPFSVFSLGAGVRYKILRWFAVGGGLGYRFLYGAEPEVIDAFQGPYYKYGVNILFGELYRVIFKRDELDEW